LEGHVSGHVEVRPARLGLVFAPTHETIRHAAHLACSAWGGLYFPWIDPRNPKSAERTAEALSVDAFVPLDATAGSDTLARKAGFFWRGMTGDAFGPPMDVIAGRVQGPEWLMDERLTNAVSPQWDPEDRLASLFNVWFGGYGESDYERKIGERFASVAARIDLSPGEPLPNLSEWITPIHLTTGRVECTGSPSLGFVLVDPESATDLALFWNTRAQGSWAFPWPAGYEERVTGAARAWFAQALSSGQVAHVRSGSGQDLGPHLTLWSTDASPRISAALAEFLGAGSPTIETPETMLPWGWTGTHSLRTGFSRTFSIQLKDEVEDLHVGIPRNDPGWERTPSREIGVVAAQITIFSESGLPTGYTVGVPRIRELSDVLDRQNVPIWPPFERPTGDGRVIGVRADAEEVIVRPVATSLLFAQLVADAGWKVGQSDNGRFASRLIDMLGGVHSQVANQPAIRAVLDDAARTPNGRHLARLRDTARHKQGDWPPEFMDTPERRAAYPTGAVYHLIQTKLLRAALPVKCPSCAITMRLSPEELATELRCEMCYKTFPLGLAIAAAGGRATWLYRLAGAVPLDNLRETLLLMAVLGAFSDWTGFMAPSTMPHTLGLEVRTDEGRREVDLSLVLDDSGRPTVILGEGKSWRGDVDRNDLEGLIQIQSYLRAKGIETFVLAATFRDKLTPEEVGALRDMAEKAPKTLECHQSNPALPIIFTGRDLSLPRTHSDHPSRWGDRRPTMPLLALESCKRNLGLRDVNWQWDAAGASHFQLSWG
jgi:hypothetical protein